MIQFYVDRIKQREEEEMGEDTGSTAGKMSVDIDDGSTEPVESDSSEAFPSTPKVEEAQPDLERSASKFTRPTPWSRSSSCLTIYE